MALSLRLDAVMEKRIEEEARRRGISKTDVVKDALERVLGCKNPAEIYREIMTRRELRKTDPAGPPTENSVDSGKKFAALLRAKYQANQANQPNPAP